MAFDISQKVKIVNPAANVDYYYGTYASIAEACASVPSEIRVKGKTVGILTDDGVVEYWWKNGVADSDLIVKSASASKIIHVINNNDILLLEDESGEYYNRIKNLVVGDLFLWDDYAYTYYYDGTGTKSIQFERNCVYRIIPFDSFPKIERIDLRPNFDEHIVDSINRVDDETPNRIVKLLASCEGEYDWDVDEVGKLDGVRISIVKDGSTTTRSFLLDYPLLFKVADGNYKQLYGDDGYVSAAMIKVVTPSSNGLMSASDKSKLDDIPTGGSNLAHEWIGSALKITSSNGTSTSVDLKGDPGDMDAVDSFDFSSLRIMGGQPEMLFAPGTPKDGLVPDNWKQHADGGYDWNGTPSMLGQKYIDTSVSQGGLYVAVRDGEYSLKWQKIS